MAKLNGDKLVEQLVQLDPILFFGVCRWLSVEIMEEDGKTPLPANKIIDNFLGKYASWKLSVKSESPPRQSPPGR